MTEKVEVKGLDKLIETVKQLPYGFHDITKFDREKELMEIQRKQTNILRNQTTFTKLLALATVILALGYVLSFFKIEISYQDDVILTIILLLVVGFFVLFIILLIKEVCMLPFKKY